MSFTHPDPLDGRFDDTVWYVSAARFIAAGEGYVNPFTGLPTAWWPPGYPFFLGGVFAIFGEGVWQAIGANIALQLLAIPAVYAIALLVFDRRTALVAAFAVALWPGQIYFSSLALSEPLFTLLLLIAVLLMLLVPGAGRWRAATVVAFGAVTALAMLTRGQAAVLIPVAIAAWMLMGMRWRDTLAYAGLSVVALGLCMTPWVLRNNEQLGSPVIVSTNMGGNLWIGHHEDATGRMTISQPEPPVPPKGSLPWIEWEVEGDRQLRDEAIEYMLTHPMDELRLSLTKIRALYEADSTAIDWNTGFVGGEPLGSATMEQALRDLANGFWFAMLGLSAAGLVAARSSLRGPAGALVVLVVAWTATHVLFFGDPRFHYPIVFVFAALGARGLVMIFEAIRAKLGRGGRPEPQAGRSRYAAA